MFICFFYTPEVLNWPQSSVLHKEYPLLNIPHFSRNCVFNEITKNNIHYLILFQLTSLYKQTLIEGDFSKKLIIFLIIPNIFLKKLKIILRARSKEYKGVLQNTYKSLLRITKRVCRLAHPFCNYYLGQVTIWKFIKVNR